MFKVGQYVILGGRKYRVCSLTIHDDVFCLETPGGNYFHAHSMNLRAAP